MNEKIRKIIGQILPTPRGEWSSARIYNKLDFVLYEGSGYIALNSTDNKTPFNEKYWIHIYNKNVWDESSVYLMYDFVSYNNKYYCKKICDMSPTEKNEDYWKQATLKGEFATNQLNEKYDIRKYNNDFYLCIEHNFGINPLDETKWVKVDMMGSYNKFLVYKQYDVVTKDGIYYFKKTSSQIPTDTNYWSEVKLQGEWSQDNVYYGYDIFNINLSNTCDIIKYQDLYYLCIKNTDSHSPINSKDWYMVCQRGEQGEKGDTSTNAPLFRGTWSEDLTYHILDVIYYNGSSYICMKINKNIKPDDPQFLTNGSEHVQYWQLICKGIDYKITDTGEVIFNNPNIKGFKTYSDNVYFKEQENEISLTQKIDELQKQLDKCTNILKKYQLD